MKKFLMLTLSYILVAALAAGLALHFWGNPEPTKLDRLESLIEERFIGTVDAAAIGDAAAEAMVQALGDRWSYYIPADEYQAYREQMANAYVGIGITIALREDGQGIDVMIVNEGGPAQEAGMLVGDRILSVAGQSILELDLTQIRDLVRGKEGTFVELLVERQGQELSLAVERRQVKTPVATYTLLEEKVGLVTIANFDERCAQETVAAIEALREQGAEKLVFDVRNNPGGYAHELVKVLDYLLPEGDLFRSVDYLGREQVDRSDAEHLEMPMAVLLNESSFSAAEFFGAALREYGAAILVGTQTVGKGYFQTTLSLGDGSAVGLSVGKYFTPKGVSLGDTGGLTPDIPVEVDDDTFAKIYYQSLPPMEDPQILAALEALKD